VEGAILLMETCEVESVATLEHARLSNQIGAERAPTNLTDFLVDETESLALK